jgi:hypothetical protein
MTSVKFPGHHVLNACLELGYMRGWSSISSVFVLFYYRVVRNTALITTFLTLHYDI